MVSVLLGGPPPELESAADGRPRLRLVPVEPLDPVGTDPVRPSGTEPASTDSASDADESGGDGQRAG
ncbi:hypothetical protein BJF85_01675 [Saccharomonospora sp. CUA-673]|uniref:hypothetical protein n=1 Tax=Saccharomonospora sp. CUA-673 TaxID=1904969 RepID=UPI000967EEA5|nr:hypothetical protein [Saccharomonospora sp. CUA-673]OLT45147.1 hypothetical protein BJF85_01675 [Saccharomonospora sp. CUA-673]